MILNYYESSGACRARESGFGYFTAGTKHIEAPHIDPNCDIPGGYVNIDQLLKQVGNYTRHYFDLRGRRGDQPPIKYYPMIYMIDRFGEDFCTEDHEGLAKLHYDFATKATGVLRTLCIRNSPQRNALSSARNLTHGIFNAGLMTATRNGYGIVRLFEDSDSQRCLGINTP